MGHVFSLSNLIKAYRYLKKNGAAAVFSAVQERILQDGKNDWRYQRPDRETLEAQRKDAIASFEAMAFSEAATSLDTMASSETMVSSETAVSSEPAASAEEKGAPVLFSIAVPAFKTNPVYLKELLDSLQEQSYPYWELLLADAGGEDSMEQAVRERKDDRIRYIRLEANEGIAGNTNAAICRASGRYIGLLDHDDVLTPDALYEMAHALKEKEKRGIHPIFLYSDEDKWDGEDSYYEPHHKLDFNLDLLLSNNYICHFLVMEASLMKRLLLRPGFDGAQDYDLVLRASADVLRDKAEELCVHIPKVLYHWRCHKESTASNPASKTYAYEAGRRALEDFAKNQGWNVRIHDTRHLGFYRMEFLPDVLSQRKDIAAAAGPLPSVKGKLISGIYDTDQQGNTKMRYQDLRRSFSGYMHRAVLLQDVETADIRTMQVSPQWQSALDHALQKIREGADPIQTSIQLCKEMRKEGFRILWDPCRKEGTH